MVVTNLGRVGCPVIRYRTGDLVQARRQHDSGGILGRADDMMHVRGNNVYPTAIEAIVRRFADVVEFRIVVDEREPMVDLELVVETISRDAAGDAVAVQVQRAIRDELLFRVEVTAARRGVCRASR